MRFESVKAHAFGPFRNKELPLAPGMNVVYGANEAGKSSWHAALYAGLCGMRRGLGAPAKEDKEFAERHRPWDDDGAWEVGAHVALEDGRRVELHHDLAGVNRWAKDAVKHGVDYSSSIMHDGAPDGSRFLGMTRRSFLRSACVQQSEVLGLLDDNGPLILDNALQLAADTAGSGITASQAIAALLGYHSIQVGSPQAWTKPLVTSQQAVKGAERNLETAQEDHRDYLRRSSEVDQLEREVRNLEREASAIKAVLAEGPVEKAERQFARASELAERFLDGPPTRAGAPAGFNIGAAVTTWEALPELQTPAGATTDELEAQFSRVEQEIKAKPDVPPRPRRSKLWLPVAASGIVAGSALAITGLVGPGLALVLVALCLLVWWFISRPRVALTIDYRTTAELVEHREAINRQIDERREAEHEYDDARRKRREATDSVREAARSAGLDADDIDIQVLVQRLIQWQRDLPALIEEINRQSKDWNELQLLLSGKKLEQLDEEARALRKTADQLAARVDAETLTLTRQGSPTNDQLTELELIISPKHDELLEKRGALGASATGLPSVVDAEETLAEAQQKLKHVEQLGQTLTTTMDFLEAAQKHVHNEIAPRLRETVLKWLPQVTEGRYTDCKVNPQSLTVEVYGDGGKWRQTQRLSHGTAEQVYLLARLALARVPHEAGRELPAHSRRRGGRLRQQP